MSYEEKIINGALMWRGTPDGKWTPVSIEIVTQRLIEALQAAAEAEKQAAAAKDANETII